MMIDSYSFELSDQLATTVQSYEEGRQRYWENLGGWSAIRYEQAERFAQAVLKNSEQLICAEEIDGDLSKLQCEMRRKKEFNKRIVGILGSNLPSNKKTALIRDVLKDYPEDPASQDSPLKLVWERFTIDMSWAAIHTIVEGASRIFQLYELVLTSIPSEPTQEFLGRLSRCYIWGFDPECVILCRAVIDTAFDDFVPDDICEKHREFHIDNKGKHYYTLTNRIKASFQERLIDRELREKAFIIKRNGDDAVHRQPGITKDVWGTICDTVAVLEKITRQN